MLSKKEDKRLRSDLEKIKHICKCGHPVYFSNCYDFSYCTYCWRRVYRDEATEFKYKLLEVLGQSNNDERKFGSENKRRTI